MGEIPKRLILKHPYLLGRRVRLSLETETIVSVVAVLGM